MRIAITLLLAAGSVARADDFTSAKVGDYTIEAGGTVAKGPIKSPLFDAKDVSVENFVVDEKTKRVSFSTRAFCGSNSRDYKFTLVQLEARISNVQALKLHLAKKYKEAAVGFERAAKLDPTWNIPAYNLASARNNKNDRAGAITALAPWFASNSTQTYFQILTDPELKSLATEKEIAAIKAAKRGTATHASPGYLYSSERNLIAYQVPRSQSYLACVVTSDLEIHDTKTGKRLATIPMITDDDAAAVQCNNPMEGPTKSSQKKLAERLVKRMPAVDAFLGDLGFNVVEAESASLPRASDNDGKEVKVKTAFPKSKLYAVMGKNGMNIHRGNVVVGSVSGSDQLDYIEAAKYMVGISHNQNEGGCPNETFDSGPIK